MLLYHGSNVIVDKPKLIQQTRGLDFGQGFYLTSRKEQAERFSEIVVNRRKNGLATVSVYEFNLQAAEESLNIKKFGQADGKWLQFVVENRLNKYTGNKYDIVIGAVANDTVMPAIQAFIGGFINEEATIITLKTNKLFDQWCLKSEKALSMLQFIQSYKVGGKIDG
jgi:hypothetical protein